MIAIVHSIYSQSVDALALNAGSMDNDARRYCIDNNLDLIKHVCETTVTLTFEINISSSGISLAPMIFDYAVKHVIFVNTVYQLLLYLISLYLHCNMGCWHGLLLYNTNMYMSREPILSL